MARSSWCCNLRRHGSPISVFLSLSLSLSLFYPRVFLRQVICFSRMYRDNTHLPSSMEITNQCHQAGPDDSCHPCGGNLLAFKSRSSPIEIIVTRYNTNAFVSCVTWQRICLKEDHSLPVQHAQHFILIFHFRLPMARDYGLRVNPESFFIRFSRSPLAGKRKILSDTRWLFF